MKRWKAKDPGPAIAGFATRVADTDLHAICIQYFAGFGSKRILTVNIFGKMIKISLNNCFSKRFIVSLEGEH